MDQHNSIAHRTAGFCEAYGLKVPILLAPMAGACPEKLSIAVMQGGGMGACGVLMLRPDQIAAWASAVAPFGPFQMNTWVPDPAPVRDVGKEAAMRGFLSGLGPTVAETAGDLPAPDFAAQCEAMLAANPKVMSSIMGMFPAGFVSRMKAQGIKWFAIVTTVAEALQAEKAGADAIIAQGMEAGGHRGAFDRTKAENMVGLFALLPAVVDAVTVPVIATGGIAEARGVAAALTLGASAVQIGTGFLRCPDSGIAPAWQQALAETAPEDTTATRVFSGRLGRAIRTEFTETAPDPADYPVQRNLTAAMRAEAIQQDDLQRMQAWAGQSARLGGDQPAAQMVQDIWTQTRGILRL